jgi:type IV fimbrial biogenesis protein FimT
MAGVTLTELMLAVGIGVILLTLGVSAFSDVVARNARVAEVNDMVAHLGYARSEAVLRSTDVAVCALANADPRAGCSDERQAWARGYGVVAVSSGEVLRVASPSGRLRIAANVDRFVFQPDGTLQGAAGGRIEFCDTADAAASDAARTADVVAPRRLIVSGPGRVRLASAADIDCS